MATKIICSKHDMVQYLNQSAHTLLNEELNCLPFFLHSSPFSCISDNRINPDPFKIMLSGRSDPCAVFGILPTVA